MNVLDRPLVTVLTPTTSDRFHFNTRIREIVSMQDYPFIEHIIEMDNSLPLGEKINRMIAGSKGSIIINLDSDDFFAPDWISKSVDCLLKNKADVIGLKKAYFYSPSKNELYTYTYPDNDKYLFGGTMCHTREYWERNKYRPVMVGYDNWFTHDAPCNIAILDYTDGFIATIHADNVSPKNTTGDRWRLIQNIPTSLHSLLKLYSPLILP